MISGETDNGRGAEGDGRKEDGGVGEIRKHECTVLGTHE